MQRKLRTIFVGVLVLLMTVNPAAAWHHWGGGGYRGGYGGCGYGGGCGGGYYGGGYSSCYGGGYGYPRVMYSSDSYCGGGACGGCGSCENCGGCGGDCGSCGGGCDGCSSCDGCGAGGTVIESSPHVYQETAPTPPGEVHTEPMHSAPPARVNRPIETTAPPPTLPPQRTTPAEAADPLFGETPETTTTPAETFPPAESTPEAIPPAETTPPAEDSGLFGPTTPTETPATTPAETPATDDFFGTETSAPTTPPAPTETPAESTPAGAGTDSLFGEPTGTTPESTPTTPESPAEGTSTPAEDPLDMFNEPAGGDSTSIDKNRNDQIPAVLASHKVLGEPGGLASNEMRTWVDNTGYYSCNGRLVRFMDGHVRLLKENGRTTTVPLYRLSAADLAFVHRQASAQPQATFAHTEAGADEAVAAN